MKRISVEIETSDRSLSRELAKSGLALGEKLELSAGNTVEFTGELVTKTLGAPRVLEIVLEISSTVGLGLLTNFLYDMLKHRPAKLRIRRTEVQIEKGEITRVLTEEIEQD